MLGAVRRSLSIRLLAVFLILAGIFVYGTIESIRWLYRADDLRELISEHLSLHVDYVRKDIGDPPSIANARAITERVPVDIRLVGPGLNWSSDERFPSLDELTFGGSDLFSEEPDALLDELQNVEFARSGPHRFLKIAQDDYAIVVSTPKIVELPVRLDVRLVIIGLGLILLLLGYLSVRWLFRPIGQIRAGAARIGRGDFEHRIAHHRHDELGELAADVNAMASSVEAMLDAKRQLLLGISHELRSPLSRMRIALEFIEDDEQRDHLRAEILEMEAITTTLLDAETLNTRHAKLNVESVSLGDIFDELFTLYFDRQRARLELHIDDPKRIINVDRGRCVLMLKNVVSNALRYSPADAGPVVVDARALGEHLIIRVADYGPGLSAEQRKRIGQPFYRGDPSRARSTGGTGLGVYLARMICEAHGGSIAVDAKYADGACFEIRLPVA